MCLTCCKGPQKSDGEYFINHPTKGTIKIQYANCINPKCKKIILKLFVGILSSKIEKLNGKKAEEFYAKYPKPLIPLKFESAEKATWRYGKSIDRINKSKKIRTQIHNSYSLTTGRKYKEEFKETTKLNKELIAV